ncbi:hypothetical protein J1N35_006039 [Gossypium stocksii]|uniref:Uncharacterized protein n=1 Tax=Gossypium stocksii TaxID=47602 RepID=A0A9D3WE43_9ROSI|nr:hypothetical protein J1N35_006039 [Gossypium stocksii]
MPEYMPWFRIHGRRRMRDRTRHRWGAILFTNPIALWDSNTFAMNNANTSRFIILSRWVILPTPTTRSPARGTTIPAQGSTTPARS